MSSFSVFVCETDREIERDREIKRDRERQRDRETKTDKCERDYLSIALIHRNSITKKGSTKI